MPGMSGNCSANSAGVPNGPWAGRWSATKTPLANGSARPGRRLKKSPKRRAHHRLHRRKRVEPASTPMSDLGSARTDAGAPVPFQLENHFHSSRNDDLELLLPDLRQGRGQGGDDSLPGSSPSALEISPVSGLGPAACPPQPAGGRVPRFARRPDRRRIPSALRAGTESRRISLGLLEAPPATERVRERSLASQRPRPTDIATLAPSTPTDHRLLETSFFVRLITLYYAGLSKVTRRPFEHCFFRSLLALKLDGSLLACALADGWNSLRCR